jgi:hypothetical protein
MPAVDALIGPEQVGFIRGRRSDGHIVNLTTGFYEALYAKRQHYVLSLDLEKAFDSVDHEWILLVLSYLGFPSYFVNLVRNLLNEVMVTPCVGAPGKRWIAILRGVKQGCPLSPILFILCYEPLLRCLVANCSLDLHKFAYADDLALSTGNFSSIQSALPWLERFSDYAGPRFNFSKSSISLCLRTFLRNPPPHWFALVISLLGH